MNMDERIINFMQESTCATISCIDSEQGTYSFNCFIYFDKEKQCCYFKSSSYGTKHGALLADNNRVSGTILPNKLEINNIRGIQFLGQVSKNTIFDVQQAMMYHTHFPMAMAIPGDMWTLRFDYIKFTDNSLGFGTKIEWELND